MPRNLIPSDTSIKAIKRGDPRNRLNDGGGLYLLLFVNGGSHGWRLDYSHGGKRKTLSLGTYPDTGLALARRKAESAREQLAEGTDPSVARKAAKERTARQAEAQALEAAGLPGPGTFEHLAREWLEHVHEAKVSEGHAERTRIRFEQDAFPYIGRRPVAEIYGPELLVVLRRVTARGAIETAHRLKDACGQVFRYGIVSGLCARNPAADLRDVLPPVQTRHHAAIVDPGQAGELLRAMADYAGHPVTRAALALSALLMLRPGELRQAEWAWVDLDAAELKVPAALMKRRKADKLNGPPHLVPLAPQAMTIFLELQPLTGDGRYCFPALHTADRPMSENTVNTALRRMGFDRDTATAHGFRAMARTLAAERLGIAPEVIEAQLAHEVSDSLGRAYNRTKFVEQRRELMTKWADYLDRLRVGATVVPLPERSAQR
jgi:integrase